MKAREARLHAQFKAVDAEGDERFAALLDDFERRERDILRPLADRGNAEAMHRLATRLRDSSTPEDVRRWLSLEIAASDLGHPAAHDELVRWYWHQRGDGSIDDVQRHRSVALEYAGKAAAAGHLYSLERVAIYVAGDVHQYPADLEIAQHVMELCAKLGYVPCAERLVMKGGYEYRLSAEERYLWLSRLALREPQRFAHLRDQAWSNLQPSCESEIARLELTWLPVQWHEVEPEWVEIKRVILERGASSVGPDAPCTTATPWCRGQMIGH